MTDDTDNGYAARLAAAMGTTSTQALADHLGVSYQAVQKVLKGTSKFFTLPNHYKVADFLGVNPRWLATGEGERRAAKAGPPADWRTVALFLARSHPHESKRFELGDFCRRVDEEFNDIEDPTRLPGKFTTQDQ